MSKPSKFVTNSSFATLKNDDGATTTATFIGGSSVGAGIFTQITSDLTIGAKASINRIQISSSKDSSIRYSTSSLSYTRTGISGGVGTPYGIYAFVSRTSTTNLRCSVYVPNPTGATLTTEATNETFTFYIDTFIPPFTS